MCGYVREDSAHLLIKCKKVKEVWRDLELEGTRMRMENTITVGEALNIIWELPERKRMEVFLFMWHWGNNRNKRRNGDQVKSGQWSYPNPGSATDASDAYAAELWAMTHAFDLACELGASRMEMESDFELLVNAMNNSYMDFSEHAMRTWFFFCEVKACCRKANIAAHSLAKLGVACDGDYALHLEYDVRVQVAVFVRGDLPIYPINAIA
ncbi:hypothetical protein D1007_52294 [Hordeum vulgare]|nr:hypothetical protein D1007_52294 [Hordeum vulgare]